jgi:hypothetical protein
MRRRFATFSVIGGMVMALAGVSIGVLSASAQPQEEEKVTICHRNDNAKDPYVEITVDLSAVDGAGGGDHFAEHNELLVTSDAEAEARKDVGEKWGDIIPPTSAQPSGLNWPAGEAILENHCEFVTPTPPTVTPETAPQAPPGPTAAPSAPVRAAPRVAG